MATEDEGPPPLGPPEPLGVFRNSSNLEIPLPTTYRRATDVKYLISLLLFTIVVLPFLIYFIIQVDIRRGLGVYDNCGNLCGYENDFDKFPCSGENYVDSPYLIVHSISSELSFLDIISIDAKNLRHCARSCPKNATKIGKVCLVEGDKGSKFVFLAMKYDIFVARWSILLSVGVCTGFIFLVEILFTYRLRIMFWINIYGSVLFFAAVTGYLWHLYFKNESTLYLVLSIILSIISAAVALCMLSAWLPIRFVLPLFVEATTANAAMPLIQLISTIVSLIQVTMFTGIAFLIFLFMTSSGTLKEISLEIYDYTNDAITWIAIILCIVLYAWYLVFIVGCLQLIVAWAVSSWYFSRNNSSSTAIRVVLRYHLGTAAAGSLQFSLMLIIFEIVLTISPYLKCLRESCVSENDEEEAFIEHSLYEPMTQTAMHGEPYFKSNRRSAKLLHKNPVSFQELENKMALPLPAITLFPLIVAVGLGCFIIIISGVENYVVPCLVTAFLILIISIVSDLTWTTIKIIFICYCEDILLNDGKGKPYAGSKDLIEFFELFKTLFPRPPQAS